MIQKHRRRLLQDGARTPRQGGRRPRQRAPAVEDARAARRRHPRQGLVRPVERQSRQVLRRHTPFHSLEHFKIMAAIRKRYWLIFWKLLRIFGPDSPFEESDSEEEEEEEDDDDTSTIDGGSNILKCFFNV